jgi:SAM-dependent methyltransferase
MACLGYMVIPQPMVEVRCSVCGNQSYEVICTPARVKADLEYVRRFHRRRLRPTKNGSPPPSSLADRANFTQDYSTAIVACMVCGLVYRNPRPPAGAVKQAYEKEHYGHERLAAMFDAHVELYRPKAQYLRRWLAGSTVRIVEVGSFVGGFLTAGREYGWQMLGVDPGKEVDAFCKEHGLQVVRETLGEVQLANNSIDCVAIWNTFDQLPDPEPTVSIARRLLRIGGVLALRIPSGECFRRAQWLATVLPRPFAGWVRVAMAWNNLMAFPYLHGYSVQTLDHLLMRYGFQRLAVEPDTLVRLSDSQTKTWAEWEERLLKGAWRAAYRLPGIRGVALPTAPWFDAYYRVL